MVDLRSLKNDPKREKGAGEMEKKCWFTDCIRTDPGAMLKNRVTNEVYQICPDHVTKMNEILEDDGNSIHPTYFDWDFFVDLYGDGEFYAETRFEPTPMGYKGGSNLRSLFVLLYNSPGDADSVTMLSNDDGSPAIFPYPEEAFEAGYGRLGPGVAEFQAVELNPKMVTIEPKE
jgi:hypothetical protein